MRRALLVILGCLFAGSLFLLWWIFRDTPEKVLRDGFSKLLSAQTATNVVAEIAWTDPVTRSTTGFGAAGQVDLHDVTRPRALGVLRIAEREGVQEETADVVIEQDRFAIRPRSVASSTRREYEDLSGDATGERFIVLQRDPFLDAHDWSQAIASGRSADIRSTLRAFPSVVAVAGAWTKRPGSISVPFRFQGDAVQPFLSALLQVWLNDAPTSEDALWIQRSSSGLARGRFSLTIDRRTREPLQLEGEWPEMDEQGNELRRIRVRLDVSGLNRPVSIEIPEDTVDVTDRVIKPKTGGSLPAAALKPLPEAATVSGTYANVGASFSASGTYDVNTGKILNEEDVDLFHKYVEELQRQRETY